MIIYPKTSIQDSIPETFKNIQAQEVYDAKPVSFIFDTMGGRALGVTVLLLILILFYFQFKRYLRNSYRRDAIQKLSEATSASEVLIILKMVALQSFGREEVGSLYGKPWLEFLEKTGKGVVFISFESEIQNSVQRNEKLDAHVRQQILMNSKKWIKTHV
ncbi:DUF4381 domain-containing protein [Joostella sp.]|uniref:DUF4381 domain-containing protein n=1 Tax=Joostella sp. TaxID=2231138 RepID=UPI003A8D1AF6